jgi:NTP pyrophosphatase (non-canonical NTP hydrolase)
MMNATQEHKREPPEANIHPQRLTNQDALVIDNEKLACALTRFASDRDWDQFHTPKNLASALAVESSELLEIFQWSRGQNGWDDVSDSDIRAKTEEELSDILLYLIRFADKAGIDLQKAAEKKLEINARKYPVEKSKGSDRKYNE